MMLICKAMFLQDKYLQHSIIKAGSQVVWHQLGNWTHQFNLISGHSWILACSRVCIVSWEILKQEWVMKSLEQWGRKIYAKVITDV